MSDQRLMQIGVIVRAEILLTSLVIGRLFLWRFQRALSACSAQPGIEILHGVMPIIWDHQLRRKDEFSIPDPANVEQTIEIK
jgi:hypothetical protein